MRIKSLKTSKYKNLQNIDIRFDADLITLLVGENGLGKSNLIEIFTLIFKDLYTIQEKKDFIESAVKSELNDYVIEYECRGHNIKIDYHDEHINIYIENNKTYQIISFAEFKRNSNCFLPDRIMGYYSGENKRIEGLLIDYIKKGKRAQQRAYKKGNINKRFRNIFITENKHSQLILFTLILYWDHPEFRPAIDNVLCNVLEVDEMTGFEIVFNSPSFINLDKLKKSKTTLEYYIGEILSTNDFNQFTDVDIFWGIRGDVDALLRVLLFEYLGTPYCNIYEDNNKEYFSINENLLSYDTLVDKIYTVFPNPIDFFNALEAASSIGMIDELNLKISKIGCEDFYNFASLSEGEQQLISVLGFMAILKEDIDEVLYLIDEPDTHINPKWQRNYIQMLLDNIKNKRHRHMFISTHSPFLVQAYGENVDILLFRKNEHKNIIIDKADNTIKNWRIDQVLMSPYFNLASTRPSNIDEFMERRLEIIKRGEFSEEDKTKLKEYENELGFLPTGETLLEVESMAYIAQAAERYRKEKRI